MDLYDIDVVLCIDKTGSMASILYEIKGKALNLYKKYITVLEDEGKSVAQFRVKIIAFGDYGIDERPMQISEFFTMPYQNEEFTSFVGSIDVKGGGDEPENALEALAHAIKSDWSTETGVTHRQVIMVFTDAPALELGVRTDLSKDDEPMTMPLNLKQLEEWYDTMDKSTRRLIVFAPNNYPWNELLTWNNVTYFPATPGFGCGDLNVSEAIESLLKKDG